MRSVIVLLTALLVYTGCGATVSNIALESHTMPKEQGYETYQQKLAVDEKEATKILRTMVSLARSYDKTQRSTNISQMAQAAINQGRKLYAQGKRLEGSQLAIAGFYNSVRVEPSEITDIQTSLKSPTYKKAVIEMQEYDISNGCKNGIDKLFSGFEKRYLYLGTIKEKESWNFYLHYPILKKQEPGLGDSRCHQKYYIGSEAHANLITNILKDYLQTVEKK